MSTEKFEYVIFRNFAANLTPEFYFGVNGTPEEIVKRVDILNDSNPDKPFHDYALAEIFEEWTGIDINKS